MTLLALLVLLSVGGWAHGIVGFFRAGRALAELRELRQLREENGKLKRLVADLSLDRHILQEIVRKKL